MKISADIDFILVGGLTALVQGAPVTTMDVDIVHHQSHENIAKLLSFLKSIDEFHRRPYDKVIEPKESNTSGMGPAFFTTRLGPLGALAVIGEGISANCQKKPDKGLSFYHDHHSRKMIPWGSDSPNMASWSW